MPYAKIIGTGWFVPEEMITNEELSRMLGETEHYQEVLQGLYS